MKLQGPVEIFWTSMERSRETYMDHIETLYMDHIEIWDEMKETLKEEKYLLLSHKDCLLDQLNNFH